MTLCRDTCLGFISEYYDGADMFLTIQFLHLFDSFSPCETKEGWMICTVTGVPKLGCIYCYHTQTILKRH